MQETAARPSSGRFCPKRMITAQVKKLPKSEVEISVSVSWEKWQPQIEQAVKEFSKQMKVPGFRAGKAPRNIVEKQVGSAALLGEAADKTIRDTYPEVLKNEKIEAIGAPKAEIRKLAEGNDLEYVVKTAVVPEATLDASWKKAAAKINAEYAKKKEEIKDEEVDKEVSALANSRVQLVDVDRAAQKEDSVVLDFTVKMEGVPIEGGTSKNHPLILGRGVFIPGFEDQVMGMEKGSHKEFKLTFPADYHAKELAGKEAEFAVDLLKVQERRTPEITDEFARSLGKFENLEELRKSVREGMAEERKKQAEESRRGEYVEALIKAAKAELPEVLVHEELHRMLHEFGAQLEGMGMQLDAYLEHTKKTREELEKEWHPQAEKRVMAALALEAAAKEEGIDISSEEMEAEMNKTLAQYRSVKDIEKNIDMEKLYTYVKGKLSNDKVFELLEKM